MNLKASMFATAALGVLMLTGLAGPAGAAPVQIGNPGFENTTGQITFNEFTFGVPADWTVYDPFAITGNQTGSTNVFLGTLEPAIGGNYFGGVAPEGDKVAIMFNSGQRGAGEYGIQQTLSETLSPFTHYVLEVSVGNINSGRDSINRYFDLSGFPGYRVELLAGGEMVAEDDDILGDVILEGQFMTSMVTLTVGATHDQLGEQLGIRLVNLNQLEPGQMANELPDLEVDFDAVSLTAVPVPVPTSLALLASLFPLAWAWTRRQDPATSASTGH